MSFSLFVHLLAARLASRLSIRRRTPRTQVLSAQAIITRQPSTVLAIQLQSTQQAGKVTLPPNTEEVTLHPNTEKVALHPNTEKVALHPNTDQRANEALLYTPATMATLHGSRPVWQPSCLATRSEGLNTCSLKTIISRTTTLDVHHNCSVLQSGRQQKNIWQAWYVHDHLPPAIIHP